MQQEKNRKWSITRKRSQKTIRCDNCYHNRARGRICWLLLRVLALDNAACSQPRELSTEMTIGEPQTLDPGWNYESAGNAFSNSFVKASSPMTRDTTNIVPLLLIRAIGTEREYTISSDGLVYTFQTEDRGIKFSDGTPMDAKGLQVQLRRNGLDE